MKDLLKELFYIAEDLPIESDAFSIMCDIEDALTDKLTGEDKRLFLEFIKARNKSVEEYAINDFKRGFEAGCRFKQSFPAIVCHHE
jgi:hypothetical protein